MCGVSNCGAGWKKAGLSLNAETVSFGFGKSMSREMRRDLAIAEDGIPAVLSLVDQVYGLRNQLRQLGEAIQAQPGDVRKAIADRLRPDD